MIDKNDVKMPIQKESTEDLNEARVKKVEELLDKVNEVDNKQELRLKEDYYGKFNWFGDNMGERNKKSYFSYQEETVYDFIFSLNKSGILSDQVGMGKTIEAGMIISELAGRNELRSLLIVVPNEIMAAKWEYELEDKFGIKHHERDNKGIKEIYPAVKAIKNFDDFCKSVYECVAGEKFAELSQYGFEHTYSVNENDTLDKVLKGFIESDIKKAVELVNDGFEINEADGNPRVKFDGEAFEITCDYGKSISRKYSYDANGKLATYVKSRRLRSAEDIKELIKNKRFNRGYRELIAQELRSLFTLIGHFITTLPDEITKITKSMTSSGNYPILIIPISYSELDGDKLIQQQFLNRPLLSEIKNYKHTYITQDDDERIKEVYEDYRIIDFFIDASYQTLIVDEVHDYIDVCAKVERNNYHNANRYGEYPSDLYNRYELFDDYYFIKKSSLYKKLKSLADKANRKIFLTATPIKSDMIDFYLLTLLASNKDSEAYKKASEALERDFPTAEMRENAISQLYNSFKDCINSESVVECFCNSSGSFFKTEDGNDDKSETGGKTKRMLYPYFNSGYLREHCNKSERIRKYLLSQMSYMSMEEIVLELILAYNAEIIAEKGRSEVGIRDTLNSLDDILCEVGAHALQTRIVFRSLLNNTVRLGFEEDFSKTEDKGRGGITRVPIKRIRELLELEDGPRKWHKTYRKYGIRHTRHQTYNLSGCAYLENFGDVKKNRYKNLPIWPQRDGKLIFLLRDDVFFDSFLEVKRNKKNAGSEPIRKEDLPNFDKLKGDEAEKQKKFDNAVAIFDYINDSMSGGDAECHEPQNSKYESVELDDSGMVDYKLALVSKLMHGKDAALGSVSRKVLLFAENDRDAITEWFRYQKCAPLYGGEELDKDKLADYEKRWQSYTVDSLNKDWRVSENTEDLQSTDGNLLIIIDPKRYEKGVDLQKADTIINFDINYCPLKMEQRIGRIDRIRPSEQEQKINIISFIPLNDMSGYVINFFANELKMFTQWMGETTGIVSVPEEANALDGGEDVSFEGKVYTLERFYKYIYRLCSRETVDDNEIEKTAEEFERFFKEEKIDGYAVKVDFGFIGQLKESFDKAFCNSLSPERKGYIVKGKANRVMRFNSTMGVLEVICASDSCEKCPNNASCNNEAKKKRNIYNDFKEGAKEFFEKGSAYYGLEVQRLKDKLGGERIGNVINNDVNVLLSELERRKTDFEATRVEVMKFLDEHGNGDFSFTVSFKEFSENVLLPMKRLFWDDAVNKYIKLILDRFHLQCDSVLQSARLFEKFIKTLSIADFMNNMEGK